MSKKDKILHDMKKISELMKMLIKAMDKLFFDMSNNKQRGKYE